MNMQRGTRLQRALERAETQEHSHTNPSLQPLLAIEDRRVLAAEVRRLEAHVVALEMERRRHQPAVARRTR